MPWMVNLFLALRVLYPTKHWVASVAKFAFVFYALSCFCNWTLQVTGALATVLGWQGQVATIGTYLWLLFQFPLVRDDLVLMRWLATFDPKKNQRKKKIN